MRVSPPNTSCCCSTSTTTVTELVSYILENVADLRALSTAIVEDNELAQVLGYYEPGDGGEGSFYFDSEEATVDNGGTVIKPTDRGSGLGRWIQL